MFNLTQCYLNLSIMNDVDDELTEIKRAPTNSCKVLNYLCGEYRGRTDLPKEDFCFI